MLPHNDNENEIIFFGIINYGNGNERNVMTPTLVTLVVYHLALAIWHYHIWPRQTWLCTSSMSLCVCSWLDDPVSSYTNFHNLRGKECSGPIVLSDYSFHWPCIACFHDLFKFALTKLTAYYCMVLKKYI